MSKVAPGPNNNTSNKPPPRPSRPSRNNKKSNDSRPPKIDTKDLGGNKSSDDEEKQKGQKKGKLSRKLSEQLKATKVAPDPKTPNSKDPPATPTPKGNGGTNDFLDEEGVALMATSKKNRKRTWKEFCFACISMCMQLIKMATRRVLRLSILFILLSQTIYLPAEFMLIDWLDQEQISIEISATNDIGFKMIDTNLYFSPNDLDDEMILSTTKGGFKGCEVSLDSTTNIITSNSCDLTVEYNPELELPGMNIEATSSSLNGYVIEQTHISSNMTFKNGTSFFVRGGIIDLTLRNVNVGPSGLDIVVEKGSISLEHLNIERVSPGHSVGSISNNGGGDILVTTDSSLLVKYVHPEASYCFASKNLTVLSEVCKLSSQLNNIEGNTTTNTTSSSAATSSSTGSESASADGGDEDAEEDFVSCIGETLLCNSFNEEQCDSNVVLSPTVDLKVIDGSIYVTVEPGYVETVELGTILNVGDNEKQFGKFYDNVTNTTNQTTPALYLQQGVEMKRGPRFNRQGTRSVASAAQVFDEDPDSNHFVVFDITGMGLLSTDKFLFSNLPIYLAAEPWIMNALSGYVIEPATQIVNGRLKGTICPYRGGRLAQKPLYKLGEFMKGALHSTVSSDVIGYKTYDTKYNQRFGTPWEYTFVFEKNDLGNLQTNEIKFTNEISLQITIGLSFVLAFCLCLVGAYKIYEGVSGISKRFFAEMELVASMNKLRKNVSSSDYQDPNFKDNWLKRKEIEKAKAAMSVEEDDEDKAPLAFPFAMPEMFVDIKRRASLNSLEDFLDHHAVKVYPHELKSSTKNLMILSKFKEIYETHCFNDRLNGMPLSICQKTLKRFGVRIKTVYDASTDCFLRIRFCTEKEKLERKEMAALPNEDSLTFFVRKWCVVSPYESDRLLFREFTRRYEAFAKTSQAAAVPVTKRAMRKLGVIYKRMQIKFCEFVPFKLGENHYRIDANSVASVVSTMDEIEDGDIAELANAVLKNWLVYDLTITGIHFATIIFLGLPSIVLPIVIQCTEATTSVLPNEFRIGVDDALGWSMEFGDKLYQIRMRTFLFLLMALGLFCTIVFFIELCMYYMFQSFDLVQLSTTEPEGFRRLWVKLVYACMLYCITLFCWYISMALVWMILACILNPNAYLPYAAAAGVFVVFASSKVAIAAVVFGKLHQVVLGFIRKRMAKKVNEMITILDKLAKHADNQSSSQDPAHMKALALVESDKTLNGILEHSGIDLSLAVSLAKGNAEGIAEGAAQYGMCEGLMHCLVSCARRDRNGQMAAISELSKVEGIGASENTLRVLFRLAMPQDDQSLRLSIKEGVIHALKRNSVPHGKISPHELESIVSVGRGSISRIVDVCNELKQKNKFGPNTAYTKRMKAASGFLELLRNEDISVADITFATDWASLVTNVCFVPPRISQGLAQIRLGQCRKGEIEYIANALKIPSFALRLLVGIAKDSSNEYRLNGPGAPEFSTYIENNYNVTLNTSDLMALSATSRSSLIDISMLARVHGVDQNAATALGHLIVQERGAGNVKLGLKAMKKDEHLKWFKTMTHIPEYVVAGLLGIAGGRLGEEGAVSKSIDSVFTDLVNRLGIEDTDNRIFQVCKAITSLSGSSRRETVLDAMQVLKRHLGIPSKFGPVILFARGLMSPEEFFDRKSEHKYYRSLGMNSNVVRKFIKPKHWTFRTHLGTSEPFSEAMWKQQREDRIKYTKFVGKMTMQHSSSSLTNKKMAREFLQICLALPKIISDKLNEQALAAETIGVITALAFLPVAPTLPNMDCKKIFQNCSRLYSIETHILESLMTVAYVDYVVDNSEKSDVQVTKVRQTEQIRRGNALKDVIGHLDDILDDDKEKLRNYIDDFIVVEDAARRAMVAVSSLAKRLRQPEFSTYIVTRDHEDAFGASAGDAEVDQDFMKAILRFLHNSGVIPGSHLESGLKALVLQDSNLISSLAMCVGIKSDDVTITSQLFGKSSDKDMIKNTRNAIDAVLKNRKDYEQNNRIRRKKKKKKDDSPKYSKHWWQPEPLGPPKLTFDFFILVLSMVYCVVTPYRMFSEMGDPTTTDEFILGQGTWFWVDFVCDLIFISDVLISFITPFSLPDGTFTSEIEQITFLYLKSWFFPDLAASIPFSLIELVGFSAGSQAKNLKMLKVLKSFRLLKLLRVLRLRKTLATIKLAREALLMSQDKTTPLDLARGFVAYAAHYNEEIALETLDDNGLVVWKSPAQILQGAGRIPKAMIDGLLAIVKEGPDCQSEVKNAILALVAEEKLPLEETICRGLTSLATGEVDSIEDVAAMLGLDEDTCEGLAFIASSVTMNVTMQSLSSSGSLHKICSKLGLDLEIVSALLAVVNQDYNAADTIDQQLTLVQIDGRYLKAILCAYSDDTPRNPRKKTEILKSVYAPLASLYGGPENPELLASLVRLVQGDVTTLRKEVGSALGLSKQERDIVCSLILLCQTSKNIGDASYCVDMNLDFSPSEASDWDATRDAGVCSKNIARVFGLDQVAVTTLISAAKGDDDSLASIAEMLDCTLREAKRKIPEAGGVDPADLPGAEDDEEEEQREGGDDSIKKASTIMDADDDNDSVASSQMTGTSVGSSLSRQSSFKMGNLTDSSTAGAETIEKLVVGLNELVKAHTHGQAGKAFDSDTIKWILQMAYGNYKFDSFKMLKVFVKQMNQLEKDADGTPAVTLSMLKQLIAFSCGMSEFWEPEMWDRWDVDLDADLFASTTNQEADFFGTMGFKMQQHWIAVTFMSQFAVGKNSVWDLTDNGSVVSSKIHPDTRLVQGFAALASNNSDAIAITLNTICEKLATDAELVGALVSIAIGDENRLSREVETLAARVNADGQYSQGFVAGASLNYDFICDRLSPMANKLQIDPLICAAVVLANQCKGKASVDAWCTLCRLIAEKEDEEFDLTPEEKKNDPRYWYVEMLAAVLTNDNIIIKKYSLKIDEALGFEDESDNIVRATEGKIGSVAELLHAIANNNMGALKPFLNILQVPSEHQDLLVNIVEVFNRSFTGKALDNLDVAISKSMKKGLFPNYPDGLFVCFGASLIGELDKFGSGMEQLIQQSTTPFQYLQGFVPMLVSLQRRDGTTNMTDFIRVVSRLCDAATLDHSGRLLTRGKFMLAATKRSFQARTQTNALSAFVGNLKGKGSNENNGEADDGNPSSEQFPARRASATSDEIANLLYAIIVSDIPKLLQSIDILGVDPTLASGLLAFINKNLNDQIPREYSGNDLGLNKLAEDLCASDSSCPPQENMKHMIKILADGFGGIGGGSDGLSNSIQAVSKNYLEAGDPVMLNAIYFASVDSPSHMPKIFKSTSTMMKLVLHEYPESMYTLVSGLINLCAPTDSAESQEKAMVQSFRDLSRSYKVREQIVKAMYGLCRGKMELVRPLGQEYGEFETHKTENFFKLVMRLAPIMHINEEEEEDEQNNGDETTLEEDISPDVVFARVDKHGTGYITLDEFAEAMKMYQMKLNKIGLMKLFLSGDEEGEGLLTPEKFGDIISSFEEKMVLNIMDSLGKGMSTLINAVLVAISFILLLFGFLFVGLSTFSRPGAFGAATSSSLFLGIGNSMGEDDEDDEEDDDDEDGGSDELVEALTENMEIVEE
jgi:hypothetical protein